MVRYVQERKEQLRVATACHVDPTSGHMGVKKTVARIRERFAWKGILHDVQQIVSVEVFFDILVNTILFNCRYLHVMYVSG